MTPAAAMLLAPFVLPICLWVAWSDMKFMKIPNAAVIALFAVWLVPGLVGVALSLLPAKAWALGWGLAGAVLALGFVASAAGLVGAGDAKFAAAMAPFLTGANPRLTLALFAACLLGAVAAHRLARRLPALRRAAPDWLSWEHKDFPMGLALSGTLIFSIFAQILPAF